MKKSKGTNNSFQCLYVTDIISKIMVLSDAPYTCEYVTVCCKYKYYERMLNISIKRGKLNFNIMQTRFEVITTKYTRVLSYKC